MEINGTLDSFHILSAPQFPLGRPHEKKNRKIFIEAGVSGRERRKILGEAVFYRMQSSHGLLRVES